MHVICKQNTTFMCHMWYCCLICNDLWWSAVFKQTGMRCYSLRVDITPRNALSPFSIQKWHINAVCILSTWDEIHHARIINFRPCGRKITYMERTTHCHLRIEPVEYLVKRWHYTLIPVLEWSSAMTSIVKLC